MSDFREHINTINQVKRYLEEEKYQELHDYIERREIEVRAERDKASEYIDTLVDELK